MNHTTCLGVKLPYTSTSTDLISDADTPEDAQVCFHIRIIDNEIIIVRFFIGKIELLDRTQKNSKMLGSYSTTFMRIIYA